MAYEVLKLSSSLTMSFLKQPSIQYIPSHTVTEFTAVASWSPFERNWEWKASLHCEAAYDEVAIADTVSIRVSFESRELRSSKS